MDKIKQYLGWVLGGIGAVLVGILYSKQKRTEQLESELAGEKAKAAVQEIDNAKKQAKQTADYHLSEYERIKAEYESRKPDV